MSTETAQGKRSPWYIFHVVVFLLITFGFGYLPTFAMITPLGMKVLGAFLGAVYGWLFIALDWPSLIALLALGISGFAETTHELFISGWTFQSVSQSLLSYMFAEAIAATAFTSYIANRLMSVKAFNGRPFVMMAGILFAAALMFLLHCGLAGLFLLWSLMGTIAKYAGLPKNNKFNAFMIPSILVMFILANFIFPFNPSSIVQINFFTQGMSQIDPNITVPFVGWIVWWIVFTLAYIVAWLLFGKFVLRLKFPEIEAVGDEITKISGTKQKMTTDQRFGLIVLLGFIAGMILPNFMPREWVLTQLLNSLGLTGMLVLSLCVMCAYQKKDGKPFITMQSVSKGIVWNIIWLLVATEPLATAFNAKECGIMPSIMAVITPILTHMSSVAFLVAALVVLGLVTQVVHNFVLMVVFIPLLCPLYAQMGGNPYVLLVGLVLVLSMALATPAASYTSALMFGEPSMDKKSAYIQGFAHFTFSLVLFFVVGMPLAYLCFPY